jgi:hypothetical protein
MECSVQTIYRDDGMLRDYQDHLEYRWNEYQRCKTAIEDVEGSLADFAMVRTHCTFCNTALAKL